MLRDMLDCFQSGKKEDCNYIAVKVKMSNFADDEIIINPMSNVDSKSKYYESAYNEDLTLKNAPQNVKIVGYTYGNSFEEIEVFFNTGE